MASVFSFLNAKPSATTYSPFLIGVLTSLAVITITSIIFKSEKVKVIKSPTATLLPNLSPTEIAELPYPPDALPGGRYVESPYGTTRVFEWGPEDGRKVLLVHGITTPCLALGPVAHELVKRGCRVMLFDEWGRGYSDAPADLPYDERIYATQILITLTSSPLSWVGGPDGGFSIIGYSLGGGISICFTSYFADMVKSLVLFAPTGLIRPERVGIQRFFPFIFKYIPDSVLDSYLRKRLQRPMFPGEDKKAIVSTEVGTGEPEIQVTPPSLKYPSITVLDATKWNIAAHHGSIKSFVSVATYGPGGGLEETWKRLSLQKRKILIFVAHKDPIIVPEELKPDVERVVKGSGTEITWCNLKGAHDFPVMDAANVVVEICKFWGM